MPSLLLFSFSIIAIYMCIGFILALFWKRNDIADVMWGFGFVLLALALFWIDLRAGPIQIVITFLVLIWGIRLTWYIGKRNIQKNEEDFRYKNWRQEWGKWVYVRSFLQIFMLQGFLLVLIALPYIGMYDFDYTWGLWQIVGLSIWIIGFSFEVVADLQMSTFKKNPKNEGIIMTTGLWRYSRHPNYFGEVVVWWGIFLLVQQNILTLLYVISPILITVLIRKVSGVPMLEKKYENNLSFQKYKTTTSIFFPWFPKG